MSKPARIIGYGLGAGLIVLGVIAAVFVAGITGQALAFVLIALGLVLATSLVFYEVGLSEDRELARQARARRRARPRFRLGRERDHNRRLR